MFTKELHNRVGYTFCFTLNNPLLFRYWKGKEEIYSLAYTNWKTSDETFMKRSYMHRKRKLTLKLWIKYIYVITASG